MRDKLRDVRRLIVSDRLFLRLFLQIFLTMTVIFSLFTFYTHQNSRQTLENEFTDDTWQDARNLAESMDNFILDMQYMISILINNDTLHTFYTLRSPELISDQFAGQVQSLIMALRNSQRAIETIYVYSEASGTVFSSNEHVSLNRFEDPYWLAELEEDRVNDFRIFPYAMRDNFPYVICVARDFVVDQQRCAIAIMVDPALLPILTSLNEETDQNAFLVSDENEVIYRYRQEALTEPLDAVPALSHFDPSLTENTSIFTDDAGNYALSQTHSEDYPWSYVLVTYLPNYTSQSMLQEIALFSVFCGLILFTVLFSLFFVSRSLKPLESLRALVESPEMQSPNTIQDSENVRFIAHRISQYVQTNQVLKDELKEQLELLNQTQILALQSQINPHFLSNTLSLMYVQAADALGYNHKLPLMILNTSALIRYAIEPSHMVTLETELANTELYLSILNERYDRVLTIVQDIAPDTLDAKVPRLFIQPIIENTVFHGFSGRFDAECRLTLRSRRQRLKDAGSDTVGMLKDAGSDTVIMEILDNGKGISEEKLQELHRSINQDPASTGKGIGLRNVMHRMRLLYGENFSYHIESTLGEGTCFTLTFPYIC